MIREHEAPSRHRPPSSAAAAPPAARDLVNDYLFRWRQGEPADARAVLDEHPELGAYPTLAVDLAFEEFWLRLEAGDPPDVAEFCERFPACKQTLQETIALHAFLDENAELLATPLPTPWPEAGDWFDGFDLQRELGRGTFSRVFLAAESALGDRLVVVKISELAADEARILGRIRHPNIIPVHSVRQLPKSRLTAVCMPYLGAATLHHVFDLVVARTTLPADASAILDAIRGANTALEAEPVPPGERHTPAAALRHGRYSDGIAHLAAEMADALAYLHAQGIVHRDLKPSNVLLTPDGRPLVLDFNLSADRDGTNRLLGGTYPYMPPEQLRATAPERSLPASAVDARSDLFALGVIVYQLLTGKHPFGPLPRDFSLEEKRQLLLQRQSQGPISLLRYNPRVEPALAQVVERCLAYDPADRPLSAADLAAALRRCLTPWRRPGRWVASHSARLLRVAALLAATSVVTAGGVSVREFDGQPHLERAEQALRQGDHFLAVQHFSRALQADPNDYGARIGRGRAYLRLENFAAALQDFEKADELIQDGRTRACRAYCLNRLGQHEAAIVHYRRALEAGYATPLVHNNLGHSYFLTKDLLAAQNQLLQAIHQDPLLTTAHHNLARCELHCTFPKSLIPSVEIA